MKSPHNLLSVRSAFFAGQTGFLLNEPIAGQSTLGPVNLNLGRSGREARPPYEVHP